MDSSCGTPGDGFVFLPFSSLYETETYTSLGELTVDGETFKARQRDSDGSVHYDWISGPNNGYGFSVFCGLGSRSHAQHIADIQDFLSGIDPTTGYLRED